MDKTLKKICDLLKSRDNMRRCGAAVVLAELAPKNAQVVKALGEALSEGSDTFMNLALEALDVMGSKAAVPYVMPLLDSTEPATRLRASAIVARAGSAIVPEIKKQMPKAGRRQRIVFVDLLARVHTQDSFKVLLEQLFDPDFEVVKQLCEAVRRYTRDAKPADKLKLHKQVVQFMGTKRVKERERVLTSCLLLLGFIGRAEARTILLKYAAPQTSVYLRRHALIGLRGLTYTAAGARTVAGKIFPYLDEADTDVIRQVVDVIARLPEGSITPAQSRKLLKSKHTFVRAFAARQLADNDTVAGNRLLVDLLCHDDHDVQEIAAGALAGHKKATQVLLEKLASEKDADAAWRLARILKPHSEAVDKKTLKKFTTLAAKELLAGKPRHKPLLYFLGNVDPAAADGVMLEAGMAHKKAKRWAEAVECLRRLIHSDLFDEKVSYALTICDLKASAKDLSPRFREACHALRGFRVLLRGGADKLLARIEKDRGLDATDLYYVGFHFRDSIGEEHKFGEDLLEHVAKTWPRSREGKAVKTILKLTRAADKKTKAAGKKVGSKESTKSRKSKESKRGTGGTKKAAKKKAAKKTKR